VAGRNGVVGSKEGITVEDIMDRTVLARSIKLSIGKKSNKRLLRLVKTA
jgi:hypothetical protein